MIKYATFIHWRVICLAALLAQAGLAGAAVEQWGIFELALQGPAGGNPFTEVTLTARFSQEGISRDVSGFYDGEGIYRVRFMPESRGAWRYETRSNRAELDGRRGEFNATAPGPGNHGPVRVANTYHFAYADGTPYRPLGTTCYAWIHQGDELESHTLATLARAPFNKLRMCVFPKWYDWNRGEPARYPYAGQAPDQWDFTRFNPAFWQHLERRLTDLRALGIEADLILFHPYDGGHWGFDRMGAAADDRYLRYAVARLAAWRNVWWSLANEYDFMKTKKEDDWDRFFQIVRSSDPYGHLRSIHNGALLYNHTLPWVTHASIQNGFAVEEAGRAELYRDVYRKPIVFDEVKYEGNIPRRWGNLSAEELVQRFWEGTIAGTYVGHGETYLDPHDVLWWAKGGELHGQSPGRLAFLKKVLEEGPAGGIDPIDKWQDARTAGQAGRYYLIYFGNGRPEQWTFELPRAGLAAGQRFQVEILDTWAMTVTPVAGEFTIAPEKNYRMRAVGDRAVKLPGRPWIALRVKRVE